MSAFDSRGLGMAALLFFGFVVVLFVGSLVVPAKVLAGITLPDGSRQRYRLNGFPLFLVTLAGTAVLVVLRPTALATIHAHFWPLFAVANVAAFGFTFYLAVHGRALGRRGVAGADAPRKGALGFVQDCFYGVEISPTWWGIDLKLFSYKPSLIGLGLINASFAAVQYQEHGFLTTRMIVYQAFYLAYLINYFQFEYGMVYTWDLIAERFGWMLVWGDYVLVPFFYSIPGWFLIHDLDPMPAWQVAGLTALYVLGFVLFRGSNEQKHQFKDDPGRPIWGKPPEAIDGKLLISGFWGVGRKLNYTGELCMYYAWSLTTGFGSAWPYLLPLWLTLFFPHRAWRDEQRCKAKYGELWEAYCRKAKFRMIPFLY